MRAIAYKLASAIVLACMFALIKSLGSRYPIGEIVFARSIFALLPILWLLHHSGQWATLKTTRPLAHLHRSVAGTLSLFLSFGAVTLLPLSTATALTYAAPLFITVLAAPMLGERVPARRWSAVLVGFVGVLIVVQPDMGAGLPIGKVLGVLAAVATALALIAIRQMAATESSLAITFYFTLFGTLMGAATLPFSSVRPDGMDALRLIVVGLLGGAAQLLLTKAYHLAPASLIAPFEYATLLSAILLGFLVWGDLPNHVEWIGIAIIVAANLALAAREHSTALLQQMRTLARRKVR
ncbi:MULTISPECIES: DMT family transporter [unclassified Brenneria]|uniref:DMT family transporter n=1 Tax=unclassified Brenneria TaxID=2634434 RepID=UPI0018F0E4B9|nr:DMT family transporter [Brenneria sp. L3-3C-1]MBJ7223535.1 DMT family transporter [Brenneria sp. L3-3C-1]MEE3644776.1 DMT family transporter [Brenneria sp. L3_3C_1]